MFAFFALSFNFCAMYLRRSWSPPLGRHGKFLLNKIRIAMVRSSSLVMALPDGSLKVKQHPLRAITTGNGAKFPKKLNRKMELAA